MSSLDAIILAGGKSERLRGIVPPYHKPFIVINGKSLLVAAVDHAKDAGAKRVIVVATGENAMPVWQLVGHIPGVYVILNADGPGQAVRRGLELCLADRVLVLMSDNVHTSIDIKSITECKYAIGVQYVSVDKAKRFTRLINGQWHEGPTPLGVEESGDIAIWCGPLVIDKLCSLATLIDREKIGPYLNDLFPRFDPPSFVPVSSYDVGVPEVVQAIT